jgi:hypothetical protein
MPRRIAWRKPSGLKSIIMSDQPSVRRNCAARSMNARMLFTSESFVADF